MTTQTITGYDLLHDVGTNGNTTNLPNISDSLWVYSQFDPSITSAIGNFVNENWVATTKGSDSYDIDASNVIQTVALKSKEGSAVTFIAQSNDTHGWTSKNSYDFLSSDGVVKVKASSNSSSTEDSITGAYGNDYIQSVSYTNLGDTGKLDDIYATENITYSAKSSIGKNGYTTKHSDTFSLSYRGNGYNVNISTKTNGTYSENATDDSSNTTIAKYVFSNVDTGFNITLTGTFNNQKVALSKVSLISIDYKLTTANVSYFLGDVEGGIMPNIHVFDDQTVVVDAMQEYLMNYVVPSLMNGDNNIKISNKDGFQINAGTGKDTIIGGAGNDTIIGGAGSDKLTGSKGADIFSFGNADFYTENANGELVFNKSADLITDFNLKEHDGLDFGELGELSFYDKLADAKADNAHLFYIKGTGSVYLNTSMIDGFTPTVIITLTGKPALNIEMLSYNNFSQGS
jgi:Ca2+-binding RTX toxin-like protein